MPRPRSSDQRLTPLGVMLLLLAALARLAVPGGMMPAMTGAGPALILCSGDGAIGAADPAAPAPRPDDHGDCPFAGAGLADPTPAASPPLALAVAAAVAPPTATATDFGLPRGLGSKTIDATGPPRRG